jgi:hypothetical protein
LKYYLYPQLTWPEQDELIQGATDEFRIATEDDTLKTFTRAYPDLSGKLFRIPLVYGDIGEDASLNFSTEGRTAGIHIFTYKPHDRFPDLYEGVPLISSVDDVSVVNVADLMALNTGLLALVTNSRWVAPYTETSDISLTIHLSKDPGHTFCAFRITDFVVELSDKKEVVIPRYPMNFDAYGGGQGSFVGNTFVGTWSEPEYATGDVWSTGTVTVVLNAAKDSILSLTIEENIDWRDFESQLVFTARNIPRYWETGADLGFYVMEERVCNHVVDFEFQTRIGHEAGTRTLQSYSCSGQTELEIRLYVDAK